MENIEDLGKYTVDFLKKITLLLGYLYFGHT